MLTACGGGSDSVARTYGLSGTAAAGAPMSGATITLKDTRGVTKTTIAGMDGGFSFSDVQSLTAPLVLKAEGMVDGVPAEFYSALDTKPEDASVVTNITPITNAIVSQLTLGDPASLFVIPTQIASRITPAATSNAVAKIQLVLDNFRAQIGVSSSFDPIKTPFDANSTGLDKMLDLIRFESDVSGKMIITDKASGIVKSIQKDDSISSITKLPSAPNNLINLDLSRVKLLVSMMNQIPTGSATWLDLLEDGFLHEGLDAATFASNRSADGSDFTVQSYQFDSCNANTSVCEGTFNLKYKDGFMLPLSMPLKYSNNTWKMYGDQRMYALRFGQLVDVQIPSPQISPTAQDIRFGFDLVVKAQPFNNQGIQTPGANVFFSTNGRNSWSQVIWELVPLLGCDHLVLSGSTSCDSFISIDTLNSASVSLASIEQASLNGDFWIRIEPKTGTSPARVEFRPRLRVYSDQDKTIIRGRLISTLDASARGTTEIPVIGNAETVRVFVANSSNVEVFSAEFDVKVKTLQSMGNSITVSEACTPSDSSSQIKILVNSARSTLCQLPGSARIKSVLQLVPNPAYSAEKIRLRY